MALAWTSPRCHGDRDLKRQSLTQLCVFCVQSSSHAGGDQELVSRMKSLELENTGLHKGRNHLGSLTQYARLCVAI